MRRFALAATLALVLAARSAGGTAIVTAIEPALDDIIIGVDGKVVAPADGSGATPASSQACKFVAVGPFVAAVEGRFVDTYTANTPNPVPDMRRFLADVLARADGSLERVAEIIEAEAPPLITQALEARQQSPATREILSGATSPFGTSVAMLDGDKLRSYQVTFASAAEQDRVVTTVRFKCTFPGDCPKHRGTTYPGITKAPIRAASESTADYAYRFLSGLAQIGTDAGEPIAVLSISPKRIQWARRSRPCDLLVLPVVRSQGSSLWLWLAPVFLALALAGWWFRPRRGPQSRAESRQRTRR